MNPKTFLWLAGCLLGLLSPARGAGFIVIEQPIPFPGGRPPFAQLEVTSHHVEVKIDGQVAVTSIEEEFFNPNDQRLDGTFMFPVPKDAHLDKFSMEVGGKMVEAELLPADKARQIYEDIVRRMRDPALLEFAGRDLFKVRIFPIEPHSRKPIRITYTELLPATSGAVTYTYPMNTGNCSAAAVRSLSMKVEVKTDQPLASIYSPSHKVEIRREGANRAVVGYESKEAASESAPASATADRLSYNARTDKAVQGAGELLDALANDRLTLKEVDQKKLPAGLQGLSSKELEKRVVRARTDRAEVQQEIGKLAAKREAFLQAESKRLAAEGKGDAFDGKVTETIHEQAAKKGIKYAR